MYTNNQPPKVRIPSYVNYSNDRMPRERYGAFRSHNIVSEHKHKIWGAQRYGATYEESAYPEEWLQRFSWVGKGPAFRIPFTWRAALKRIHDYFFIRYW